MFRTLLSWLKPRNRPSGWYLAEDAHGEVHVLPNGDWIGHDADECPCGPDIEPNRRDDGSVGWLHVHHSLDNREKEE